MQAEQLTLPLSILRLLQCASAPKPLREQDPLHHLVWDKHRGKWEVRLTINLGTKVVGKRIVNKLSTADPEEAKKLRDVIIRSYEKLGLTLCDRRQKRVKHFVTE
ncbi:hypothetical protein [Luteolibacter pohnpeiensis]|nr:hypothetical protein [Luteolibacter pohnpeiensis]